MFLDLRVLALHKVHTNLSRIILILWIYIPEMTTITNYIENESKDLYNCSN